MSENGSVDTFHLTIAERFMVIGLLPDGGKFARARMAHKLSEALRLTPREIKYYELKNVTGPNGQGQVQWTDDPVKQKETRTFRIGLSGREMIRTALQKLHDSETLSPTMVPLYEKFMLDLPKESEEDLVEATAESEVS